MFDTLDEPDRRVLTALHDSVHDVASPTPVDQILARGTAMRRRRRVTGTLTGTALLAALAGTSLTIPWASSPGRHNPGREVRQVKPLNIELAGWSAHTNADSTLTITLRDPHLFDFQHPQLLEADRLRTALAGAGVPVVLEFHDLTAAPGITNIDCHLSADELVLTNRVVVNDRQDGVDDSTWKVRIRPTEMPLGAVLKLFLAPDRGTTTDRNGAVVGHPYDWTTSVMVFMTTPPPCTLTPVSGS